MKINKKRADSDDHEGEKRLREIFELDLIEDVQNGIKGDAKQNDLVFELKTSKVKSKSVQVSRQLNRNHLYRWEPRYWIVGYHKGNYNFYEYWFLTPHRMAEWIKTKHDLFDLYDACMKLMDASISKDFGSYTQEQFYLSKKLLQKCNKMNSGQSIGWSYIRKNGIQIFGKDDLRKEIINYEKYVSKYGGISQGFRTPDREQTSFPFWS